MADVNDVQLRRALKQVIKTACDADARLSGLRLAHYRLAAFEGEKWAGVLRRADDSASGKLFAGDIHCLFIYRASAAFMRKLTGGNYYDNYIGYRIRFFQKYWDNGDDDNSEDFSSLAFDTIVTAVANSRMLGLTDAQMLRHDDLQLQASATPSFNNEMAHVLDCFLGVHLRRPLAAG